MLPIWPAWRPLRTGSEAATGNRHIVQANVVQLGVRNGGAVGTNAALGPILSAYWH